MSLLRRILFAAFALPALALAARVAAAGPFTDLVVFGDSLSDVGNVDDITTGNIFFPDYPGPYYFDGRFSNGPVYVEALAVGLGLSPITRSVAGGNDFAYGGGQTSGTGFPNNLVIRDVDDQVDQFLATRTVDPDALFVVWAGSNDLFNGQMNVNVPVGNLADDLGRLAAAGATKLLVPNLPLLGFTPEYNASPVDFIEFNARSTDFNAALATALDDLEASYAGLSIFRLDVAGLFSQAIADPAAFGLTNAHDSAAPGLEPGTSSYNTNLIVDEPNEYLFWDNVHPTAAVHVILAEHALALVMPPSLPGDYNGDNGVNAADYTVYRNRLAGVGGTTLINEGATIGEVTIEDYEFWKERYGDSINIGLSLTENAASVPEPNTFVLLVVVTIFGPAARLVRFPSSKMRR